MEFKKCSKCFKMKEIEKDFLFLKKGVWNYSSSCRRCDYLLGKWRGYHKKTRSKPKAKMANNLRSRTYLALKNKKFPKNKHFNEYIGCTITELLTHFEKQFQEGMSWSNYGNKREQWSIDHIIPLSSAKSIEDMYTLCHYTNLQPMWHVENCSKSNKLNWRK